MEELNIFSQNDAVNLDDFMMKDNPFSAPFSASRNQAAITALISDPKNAVQNYQVMVAEAQSGTDSTRSALSKNIQDTVVKQDMKGVISVLSDPTLSIEQKQQVLGGIKSSQFLSDPGTTLQSKSLQAGSTGENLEQEAARLTVSDALREMHDSRQKIQGLVNAHAASLGTKGTFGDLADIYEATITPFATAKSAQELAAKMGKEQNLWQKLRDGFFAGNTYRELRDQYEALSPAGRVEFVKKLRESMSKDSGLIFSNENQFNQFMQMQTVIGEGGYSKFDQFLDNATSFLDVIGIGFLAKSLRGGTKAAKIVEAAEVPTVVDTVRTSAETIRREKQAEATRKIEEQWAFDPSKPTEDKPPTGPIPGILSDPTPGVPTLLGGSGRKAAEEAPKKQIAALFQRIETNNTVRAENPASPAKIIQQSNPEQARAIHQAVVKSDNEAVAQALYGTDKVQAVASDILPQISPNGSIISRIFDIERNIRRELNIDPRLTDMLAARGMIEITAEEKAAIRANVQNDFSSAEGMRINDAMSSFSLDGGQVLVKGVFGTPEGGFLKAEDAIEQALFAFREYGVKTEDIRILQKQGMDHVPVSLEEVRGKEGNYLVQVDTRVDMSMSDLNKIPEAKVEEFLVKKNWLDRFPVLNWGKQGSAARHVVDAASMLDKRLTGAASAVNDMATKMDKFLLEQADVFGTMFNRLDAQAKDKVSSYIKEANFKQIKFDPVALRMRGFKTEEVDAIAEWKKFWDGMYYLENYDLVKTLNNQGYQFFGNANIELFAKPIQKVFTIAGEINTAGNKIVGGEKIYNPATDSVTVLTRMEIDDLYNNGGTLARLRRPADIGGETAELMMVRNTPTEYLRKVRDSDSVLNYRDGYYQIQYTAPKFIDEITETFPNGKIKAYRTVAVAGDTKEAEHFAKRMQAASGTQYRVRGDVRAFITGSDEHWDINSAAGRIAQRHRGKLLEDASGLNHLGDGSYILNPVESAIRASRSIAGRTMSRSMLENAKMRAMKQYGHLFPSDGQGGHKWPSTIDDIKGVGEFTTAELADARTTVEYINYLENGYVNSIDNLGKYMFHYLANVSGKIGASALERGFTKAGSVQGGIGSAQRSLVFYATIAWNPLRQLLIQPHQALRTWAFNPKGWANGEIIKYISAFMKDKSGVLGKVAGKEKEFVDFLDRSGMMQAVDRHNLVRGSLQDAAESHNYFVRKAGQAANIPRKIGFDIGEMANMLVHAAAVYEQYARKGMKITDKAIQEEMVAKIRALSYDMNYAGDMPYNQNTMSMIFQFMQVPHKAVLQYTNRRLSAGEKARLLIADSVFWGIPGSYILSNMVDKSVLPEDEDLREFVLYGAESLLLNNLFKDVLGDDATKLDFSGFAPYDMTGWSKLLEAFYSGGIEQAFLASPAGSVIYKDGSRMQQAFGTLARFFGAVDDVEEDFTTFKDVLHKTAMISSGYANWYKAKMLLEAEKRFDTYGRTIEEKTDTLAAVAQMFGFGSASTRDLYRISQEISKDSKQYQEDVIKVYKDTLRMYVEESNKDIVDPVIVSKITGRMYQVFENDPAALAIINSQLMRDFQDPKLGLAERLLKLAAIPRAKDITDKINMAPIPEDQKEQIKRVLKDAQEAYRNTEEE